MTIFNDQILCISAESEFHEQILCISAESEFHDQILCISAESEFHGSFTFQQIGITWQLYFGSEMLFD
jgi:hypothetical protein